MSVPVIVSRESSNSQTSPKISTSRRQLPEPPSPKGTPASTPETPTDDVVVEFRRPGHARREVVTRTSPVRRREEHKRLVDGRHYREHCILMEYKLLAHNSPPGVYVVPSLKSLQVWHGIIFIRQGPFAGGAFRFEMVISDSFPQDTPLVKFISKVFHPQVHTNGLLNLSEAFPQWRPGEDRLWHVLQYMYECFGMISTWQPSNEKATVAVHESIEAFSVKASACVQESIRELEQSQDGDDTSADHGNCLQFTPVSDDLYVRCKYMMKTGEMPVVESEEKGFVSWVKGRFSSLLGLGDLESSSERWVAGLFPLADSLSLSSVRDSSGTSDSVSSRSDTSRTGDNSTSSQRSSVLSEVKRL